MLMPLSFCSLFEQVAAEHQLKESRRGGHVSQLTKVAVDENDSRQNPIDTDV